MNVKDLYGKMYHCSMDSVCLPLISYSAPNCKSYFQLIKSSTTHLSHTDVTGFIVVRDCLSN